MEIIKLQKDKDIVELRDKEKLPRIPELVQCYLSLDKKTQKAKGNYFKIIIDQKSEEMSGAGMSYSNALRIEKRIGMSWKEVHSTAMVRYRSGYAHIPDSRCHQMFDPTILEESEEKLIWAIRTGEDGIKVYDLEKTWWPMIEFDMRAYKKMKKRIELLKDMLNNAKNFHAYISHSLDDNWHIGKIGVWESGCQIFDKSGQKLKDSDYSKIEERGDTIMLLADHADRKCDSISDSYQLFVWVKDKGFGSTGVYKTGLYHPAGQRFYTFGIGLDAVVIDRGLNSLNLTTRVSNKRQKWEESREFVVKWDN